MNEYDFEFEKIINRSNLRYIKMPEKFDYKLSEDFIIKYRHRLYWREISGYQTLSEGFIRKYKDYVDWDKISYRQKLSHDFIQEFSDKVDWYYISCHQKLSKNSIQEFSDKVYWLAIPLCYFKIKHERFWKTFI